ncbi:MAG: DeoR/GlpR family DNA-binding transcription regulator [Oscillospiraceae bacterium]|jgi:DeoR family fructose operon transcriptional repressor|nr:DeoR/GlpR family DNA-binding transcription regulator [Oscillospiraceae bacterium]MDD3260400.1 DeoR/GlpR family DNA-binding transcription regulator [Oscillospiraceae bacterium]
MLTEERFAIILRILQEKHSVTVQQLCDALDASESTVRRDLQTLDSRGRLSRVHGGATLPDNRFVADEENMTAKETQAVAQKAAIGALAAQIVRPEDFVYIDAGSTTLQLAKSLSGGALHAAYVTNGIAHARILAQKGCRVYVLAGQVRPSTEAIVGAGAMANLQRYHFTKAFMGANGVALKEGFTTPDVEEAELKNTALSRALETWFLTDDSKFGKIYAAVICPLTEGSIFTNHLPNEKYRQYTLVKESDAK